MIEVSQRCDACGLSTPFGVAFEKPPTFDELQARVFEKLGPDAMFVCPRCQSFVLVCVDDKPLADESRVRRIEQARRIRQSATGLRFGVGDPNGPRSSVWRVWLNQRRDDVYISARGLASQIKASLHPSFWYFGFTRHHASSQQSVVPPGADRKIQTWERPEEFAPGWTRAFAIVVPDTEVTQPPFPYGGKDAVWVPPPPTAHSVHFTVLLSKPGAARGPRGYPHAEGAADSTAALTRLDMTTGEQIWIIAHVAPTTDSDLAQIERAHTSFAALQEGALRAGHAPDSEAETRAIIFADSPDGGWFYDLSVAGAVRPRSTD